MKSPTSARAAAEDRLLGLSQDLVADGAETGIVEFAKHIGLDLTSEDGGRSGWPRFRDHYTRKRVIDEARVAADMATFPPIVRRVAEIKAERAR